MNKQKETKKGEQAFNKQFLNRLARITVMHDSMDNPTKKAIKSLSFPKNLTVPQKNKKNNGLFIPQTLGPVRLVVKQISTRFKAQF